MRGEPMLPKLLVTTLFVVPFLVFSSCSNNENPTTADTERGTLVIRMTDSPARYDSIMIQVDSVRIHVSSSDTLLSGWQTINRTRAMYDLLKLTNGADTVIGQATLPPGVYSQIRLFIGDESHVVVNGVSHPLEVPSGSRSGLKLNVHTTIEPNVSYTLLLDFDAGRSITVTGNGRYKLKPVIRTIATAQTGNIDGVIVPAMTQSIVTASNAIDTISTISNNAGRFKLAYLKPASYTVSMVPGDTTYRSFTVAGVIVFPGLTTSLGTTTLTPR